MRDMSVGGSENGTNGRHSTPPRVSAVVCTRNRPQSIVPTVASIFDGSLREFELLIIDQSDDDATWRAIEPFRRDPRLRYVQDDQVGLSRARNKAIALATTDLIVFTDDDCVVGREWLSAILAFADSHPSIAGGFCSVIAAEHDTTEGYIPIAPLARTSLVTDPRQVRGMGAGMFVRREPCIFTGLFDELLGAGAEFRSFEDFDVMYRLLNLGYVVAELSQPTVVHCGLRVLGGEWRRLLWGYEYGHGATDAKLLRTGHVSFVLRSSASHMREIARPIMSQLFARRRPHGSVRLLVYMYGLWRGMQMPVDRGTIVFRTESQPPTYR